VRFYAYLARSFLRRRRGLGFCVLVKAEFHGSARAALPGL
jgi:hypothetical protein